MAVKSHFVEKVLPSLHQLLKSNDDQESEKGVAMINSADEEESPANPFEVLVVSGILRIL